MYYKKISECIVYSKDTYCCTECSLTCLNMCICVCMSLDVKYFSYPGLQLEKLESHWSKPIMIIPSPLPVIDSGAWVQASLYMEFLWWQ